MGCNDGEARCKYLVFLICRWPHLWGTNYIRLMKKVEHHSDILDIDLEGVTEWDLALSSLGWSEFALWVRRREEWIFNVQEGGLWQETFNIHYFCISSWMCRTITSPRPLTLHLDGPRDPELRPMGHEQKWWLLLWRQMYWTWYVFSTFSPIWIAGSKGLQDEEPHDGRSPTYTRCSWISDSFALGYSTYIGELYFIAACIDYLD